MQNRTIAPLGAGIGLQIPVFGPLPHIMGQGAAAEYVVTVAGTITIIMGFVLLCFRPDLHPHEGDLYPPHQSGGGGGAVGRSWSVPAPYPPLQRPGGSEGGGPSVAVMLHRLE